ncbi:MAG: AAA family ATPase [Phenylobacterium sp.]|uniref:GumC family protein n=1 Tax=Phenylobacterium sp. TaxID=1871053 RepID=UPI003919D224
MPDDNAPIELKQRLGTLANAGAVDDWKVTPQATQVLDIRRMVAVFRRRMRLFAAVGLLIFVAVFLATIQATPMYTATANVMLDTRQETVVENAAVLSGLPADSSTVDTEVEILRSRQLAERVVETLNLDQDPEFNWTLAKPSALQRLIGGVKGVLSGVSPNEAKAQSPVEKQIVHEQVVDEVLRRLSVRRVGLTYVMNVGFTSPEPAKAALIANTFAEKYLLDQLEAKFEATRQANQWLNTRLEGLRGDVLRAEAAVASYKAANNLLSASGATLTEQEISSYNQGLAAAQAEVAEKRARLNTAMRQLGAGSSGDDLGEVLGSAVITSLRAQRAQVSGRVADLSGRYGPRHPEMLKAQRELEDIDAQIQAEIQRVVSNLRAEVEVAEQRAASLAGSVSQARGALASNNSASVRLNELERNAESARSLYESYLNRFKETSSQEGLSQSDARIVSRAKIPTGQSSPNVRLNLMLGFVVAVAAGLFAVILAETWDVAFSTAEDIEQKLGMPYLGCVPELTSVAGPGAKQTWPFDYLLDNPLSSFAESVRSLRASILTSRVGRPVKVVTVTSSLPSEGKTTASVCIARISSQMGQRVVVVDCDIRRRNINRALGFEPEQGLLELLNGQVSLDEALIREEATGTWFLPLARTGFTPKDMFGSPAMDTLLAQLKERFDLIVLDAPPVLAVADARVLAPKSDAVVFLLRWRKTPEKAVRSSLKLLEASGADIVGIGFTQVDMRQQVKHGYGDPGYYYEQYRTYYS